ncbi:MAG: hypothetical protein ACKPKF_07245, partial [Microcystis panniformis]
LRRKVLGAGHKSPLQKRPPAPCRSPPAFVNDFPLNHQNKTAIIPSVWIIRNDENFPRLVTCYVL